MECLLFLLLILMMNQVGKCRSHPEVMTFGNCFCVLVLCVCVQLACRALQRGITLGQSSAAFQDINLDLAERKLTGLMDMSRVFPGMTSVAFDVDFDGGPTITFSGGKKGFPKVTLAQCVSAIGLLPFALSLLHLHLVLLLIFVVYLVLLPFLFFLLSVFFLHLVIESIFSDLFKN